MSALATQAQPKRRNSADPESRTVDVTLSTGADVLRRGPTPDGGFENWVERLSIAGANLSRLNNGASPVLVDHKAESASMLGTVESARAERGAITAKVRFGKGPLAQEYFADVADGIRRSVSVGYQVAKWRKLPAESKVAVFEAVDWTPVEISFVPVPAESAASVRGLDDDSANGAMHFREATMQTIHTRADTGAVHPAVVEDASRGQGVPDSIQTREGEVERVRTIQRLGELLRLPQHDEVLTRALGDGMSVNDARRALVDRAAEIQAPTLTRGGGGTSYSHTSMTRDAITQAVAHRLNPDVALDRSAEPFARMSIMDMDRELARMTGQRQQMQRSGMMTTSDFPILLSNAAQVALAQAYATTPPALQQIARKITTADKTPFNVLRVSSAPELLEVGEHGEIKNAPLDEASESIRVATFARLLGFSRDLILSDRLGALQDFVLMGARSANRKLGDLMYSALSSNPVMGDGTPLFHANRGNLASVGSVLNMASLEAAVVALRSMRDMDGNVAGIVPAFLIVGPKNEVLARQLVAQIQAGEAANVNPYAGLLSVVVEDRVPDRRFMVAGSLATAALGWAVLDGSRRMSTADGVPLVDFQEGWRVLGLEARVVADFGAAPLDAKAIYLNVGPA